jgi:ABC-type nitrate/sulfonate/bicarbonate transport system permease component
VVVGATLPRPRRPDWKGQAWPLTLRFGILLVVVVAWQLAGDDSAQIRMPTFTRTIGAFWSMVATGELPQALLQSNIALFWGYLLALIVAIPLGIAMGSVGVVRKVVNPYLMILLSMPLIAILPVLQAIFGLGLATRVVVVFIFSFVYITMNTVVGVRSVSADLDEMSRSFGASRLQRLFKVVLPHAFPAIMAGARLGLGRGVVGMVIAELFLVSSGLGSLLSFYMTRFDAGAVLAIALTMVLEGVVVIALARRVEAMLTRRW